MDDQTRQAIDLLAERIAELQAQNIALQYLMKQQIFVSAASQENPKAFFQKMFESVSRQVDQGEPAFTDPMIVGQIRATVEQVFTAAGAMIKRL